MMFVSGGCAIAIGFAVGGPFSLFLAVSVLWGVSVIGDSAQFSAMATEIADQRYVGTALALQLGVGFALTVVSIRLAPLVAGLTGWRWCFLFLAPGPMVGLLAMWLLGRAGTERPISPWRRSWRRSRMDSRHRDAVDPRLARMMASRHSPKNTYTTDD